MTEAVGFQYHQEDFIAETGLDFSFMFVLFAGVLGYEATEQDSAEYAEHIGDPDFPVFADGDKLLYDVTPMNGESPRGLRHWTRHEDPRVLERTRIGPDGSR